MLESIPPDLRESQATVILSDSDRYTKTLGIEWNASSDHFRVSVTELPPIECMTKRSLVSDVVKTFNALGRYSPAIVKAKVLLQTLWLEGIGWDDCVPNAVLEEWSKWRRELPLLSTHCIPRCYFPKEATIVYTQLHGFSDASEKAYAAAVYLRMEDTNGTVHTSRYVQNPSCSYQTSHDSQARVKWSIDTGTTAISLQASARHTFEFCVCMDRLHHCLSLDPRKPSLI